jgi:hypothetical protein
MASFKPSCKGPPRVSVIKPFVNYWIDQWGAQNISIKVLVIILVAHPEYVIILMTFEWLIVKYLWVN